MMTMIKAWITSKAMLIVSAIAIAMFLTSIVLGIQVGRKDDQITAQAVIIKTLEDEVAIARRQRDNQKLLCDASSAATNDRTGKINEATTNTNKVLEKLIDARVKNDKEKVVTEVPASDNLSSDVVKLLEEHCASVRGVACPNPR